MDAVKFLRESKRMCFSRDKCSTCPFLEKEVVCCIKSCTDKQLSEMAEIIENWSKENPEEVGKKYIIEVDGVNKYGHCHTCIGWLSASQLEQLKEYKGE